MNHAPDMPQRPDTVLSDAAREAMRKLFHFGPLQPGDLPRDGAPELIEHKWIEEIRGWYALTIEGVAACLTRGWGREKERARNG